MVQIHEDGPRPGGSTAVKAGAGMALLSAALFGLTTPFSKILLEDVHPVLLAALFYLGSGTGLGLLSLVRRRSSAGEAPLTRRDLPWLGGALFFGGILAPVLLMVGLRSTSASMGSLLLNLEAVFTALLAWFLFRENFNRRIAIGMAFLLAGGAVLSLGEGSGGGLSVGALSVAGACLCWGIDNNLTQKVSAGDPIRVAAIKGIVAGLVNLSIASSIASSIPSPGIVAAILLLGYLGYGVSLVLFIGSLRRLGTARTSAYFSIAPFIGTVASLIILREPVGATLLLGGCLMAAGVWLHITERHEHEHTHEPMTHDHRHVHDEHHRHDHSRGVDPGEPHAHEHEHSRLTHRHHHYPDIHHRHPH